MFGSPRTLFGGEFWGSSVEWPTYALGPDVRFLLIHMPDRIDSPRQINIVLNWFEELKCLVPAGK